MQLNFSPQAGKVDDGYIDIFINFDFVVEGCQCLMEFFLSEKENYKGNSNALHERESHAMHAMRCMRLQKGQLSRASLGSHVQSKTLNARKTQVKKNNGRMLVFCQVPNTRFLPSNRTHRRDFLF